MRPLRLTHNQAVWGMVLAPFLWSTAGVVTRQLEFAQRFEVTFWRSLFAALTLVVLLACVPALRARPAPAQALLLPERLRAAWCLQPWGWLPKARAYWVSAACWAVMFTAFMVALTLVSVAQVLVMLALGPMLTAVLGRWVLRQRLPQRTWVAVVAAVLGIATMFGSQWLQALNTPGQDTSRWMLGSALALLVPMAAAVNWIVVQRSQQHGQSVDLVSAVMGGGFLSAAATLPWALPFQASALDVAWLAFLGVFQLAVPCAISVICARSLLAAEVSLLAQLEVLFGIGLSWAMGGETPAHQVLAGGVVVMLALLVNEYLAWRERQATTL